MTPVAKLNHAGAKHERNIVHGSEPPSVHYRLYTAEAGEAGEVIELNRPSHLVWNVPFLVHIFIGLTSSITLYHSARLSRIDKRFAAGVSLLILSVLSVAWWRRSDFDATRILATTVTNPLLCHNPILQPLGEGARMRQTWSWYLRSRWPLVQPRKVCVHTHNGVHSSGVGSLLKVEELVKSR